MTFISVLISFTCWTWLPGHISISKLHFKFTFLLQSFRSYYKPFTLLPLVYNLFLLMFYHCSSLMGPPFSLFLYLGHHPYSVPQLLCVLLPKQPFNIFRIPILPFFLFFSIISLYYLFLSTYSYLFSHVFPLAHLINTFITISFPLLHSSGTTYISFFPFLCFQNYPQYIWSYII
jgi:hypothetical protein